jgi:hypothetical protein
MALSFLQKGKILIQTKRDESLEANFHLSLYGTWAFVK